MEIIVDYAPALKKIVLTQAQFLLSSEDDVDTCVANFVEKHLKRVPANSVISAYLEHRLLDKRTHTGPPKKAGMYFK